MEQELLEGGISREGRHTFLRTSLGEKLGCVSFGLTQPIMPDSRHCLCPAENGAHCPSCSFGCCVGPVAGPKGCDESGCSCPRHATVSAWLL